MEKLDTTRDELIKDLKSKHITDVAKQYGVSLSTIFQAKKFHKIEQSDYARPILDILELDREQLVSALIYSTIKEIAFKYSTTLECMYGLIKEHNISLDEVSLMFTDSLTII